MKVTTIVCNLCEGKRTACSEITGLIADDYGKHSEEYRKVPPEDSDIHLCRDCERRLYNMVNSGAT